jgi:hypothetical protein
MRGGQDSSRAVEPWSSKSSNSSSSCSSSSRFISVVTRTNLPNIGGITIVIRDMEEMPISQHRPSGGVPVPGPEGGNHTRHSEAVG